jgi:hypothetical protein
VNSNAHKENARARNRRGTPAPAHTDGSGTLSSRKPLSLNPGACYLGRAWWALWARLGAEVYRYEKGNRQILTSASNMLS